MFIAIPSRYLIRNISPIVPLCYYIKCAFKLYFKSEYEWQLIEITWKKIGFFYPNTIHVCPLFVGSNMFLKQYMST